MKVDYLFSRNNKIGSRLIAWASGYEKTGLVEVPSHVAVLINDQWVVESTLSTGVRLIPYTRWLQINEELVKIPCRKERHGIEALEITERLWDKKYDWMGIFFFAYRFAQLILFNRSLPKRNRWHDKRKYFCTEFVGELTGEDYSMYSPARLAQKFIELESTLDER